VAKIGEADGAWRAYSVAGGAWQGEGSSSFLKKRTKKLLLIKEMHS
jgi:hypothetical protein